MDISCAVCLEPWDSYGITHGDMLPWERDLFRKGAGCPCCKGETPDGVDPDDAAEEHIRDAWLRGGTDDPDAYTLGFELGVSDETPTRPAWEPPPPRIMWTCTGCGVSAGIDQNDPCQELAWIGGERVHGYYGSMVPYGNRYNDESPEDEPPYKLGDDGYCPGCATMCDYGECEAVILYRDPPGDVYDAGHGFQDPLAGYFSSRMVCTDCYETIPMCCECGEHWHSEDEAYDCCPRCEDCGSTHHDRESADACCAEDDSDDWTDGEKVEDA